MKKDQNDEALSIGYDNTILENDNATLETDNAILENDHTLSRFFH